jgi:tetratricopeptide (TPR) repeat protein
LSNQEDFFYEIMRAFFTIFLISIFLFSCGTDVSTTDENKTELTDTTETEKTIEFRAINDLLKQDVNNTSLYLKRAKLYMKYNELSLAVQDVDRAIKLDPLSPEYYLLKAELLKKQEKFKESKAVLDQCLLIDNSNLEARIELGWLALIVMDYKQALDYADAVLKRDIHYADAYFLKGIIFEDKKDTALAISSFITTTEQESDYIDAYIHLGLLHFNKPNTLAKDYLKNALRIDSTNLEALYAYALYCQENEAYNESIDTYYKILAINDFREPYFNLGYIHQVYLKVYDVAIDNYTKAIKVEPMYIDAYYNRGLCYEETNQFKKAQTDFRHALKLNPQYNNAAIALERVMKK